MPRLGSTDLKGRSRTVMRRGFLADRGAAEALRNMTELDFAEKKPGEEAEAVIYLFIFFFPSANAILPMSQPPWADLTGHGDLKTL